jgi:hypothetical protein
LVLTSVDFATRLIHNAGNRRSGDDKTMRAFKHSRIIVPLISVMAVVAFSAQAEEPGKPAPRQGQARPAVQAPHAAPRAGQARGPQDARFARGHLPARNFGGRAYHGRLAWEGGRWRHEMHNGRYGWWWDVGGAWYFYPQQMDGPPAYVSDVEFADDGGDVGPDGPPVAGDYPPPPGAYAPPPPPPDPGASAVGGAVVGGILGGLITGRPVGAAVGAIAGGTAGAIAGAQATSRAGYYLAQGNCYYRYPSGQYVQVDPRSCY